MKKAVIQTTAPESVEHQVRFEPKRFDSLIFDKGYDVFIDKAYKCPCAVKGAGQALPDCDNCLGIGWLFANRTETRIAIQSIQADVKYENWTRTTAGTARVTARAVDKLAFMDRIILQDVEGYYNEILRSKKIGGVVCFFTNYDILQIEDIMIFEGSNTPLRYLAEGTDYSIDPNVSTKIILGSAFQLATDEIVATVRYRHLQTYHILDMNRDIVKVREKNCEKPEEQLREMPIAGIARKAHYLFDNLKYKEAVELIENDRT